MPAIDTKLELKVKSVKDHEETKTVVAQLDKGEATAKETEEVIEANMSATDIKLASTTESEGDEDDAGTNLTQEVEREHLKLNRPQVTLS